MLWHLFLPVEFPPASTLHEYWLQRKQENANSNLPANFPTPRNILTLHCIASLWSINIFRNNIQIIPQRSMTQPSTIDLLAQSRGEHLFYIRNALNQLSRDTIWYFERAKLTQMHILIKYYQILPSKQFLANSLHCKLIFLLFCRLNNTAAIIFFNSEHRQ